MPKCKKIYNETLLTFAKLASNKLQNLYQKELDDISRIRLLYKLPFIRERIAKCYFWILGVRILTKVVSMTSAIDDIYDVYGKIKELEPFTSAIESAIDKLPKYMKLCHRGLLEMKNVVKIYFFEAKWYHQNYVSSMKEYMTVALDCLHPILMGILNLTHAIDVIYKYEDGYTHVGIVLKDFVVSLLVNPMPL
ncbi:hypothetical protein CISIN_1g045169mg [Citrus sinensis]|uniref:Terpene synthase metal-binding domain-containing protein n=1 Tax=Citrus sinensis TaxID=2711 RepID=A0A067E328_CITSI|nr:hypothetical protein CISIN_1g045169mg [Citrus sinensis]